MDHTWWINPLKMLIHQVWSIYFQWIHGFRSITITMFIGQNTNLGPLHSESDSHQKNKVHFTVIWHLSSNSKRKPKQWIKSQSNTAFILFQKRLILWSLQMYFLLIPSHFTKRTWKRDVNSISIWSVLIQIWNGVSLPFTCPFCRMISQAHTHSAWPQS